MTQTLSREALFAAEQTITDNLEDLLAVLPPDIVEALEEFNQPEHRSKLLEIVLDLGRRPEARFEDREVYLAEREVSREDIAYVAERIGRFGDDNRAGIERTLHRISAIRSRSACTAGIAAEPGSATPRASARQAMVEAVPMTAQVPAVTARRPSTARISASSSSPAR